MGIYDLDVKRTSCDYLLRTQKLIITMRPITAVFINMIIWSMALNKEGGLSASAENPVKHALAESSQDERSVKPEAKEEPIKDEKSSVPEAEPIKDEGSAKSEANPESVEDEKTDKTEADDPNLYDPITGDMCYWLFLLCTLVLGLILGCLLHY